MKKTRIILFAVTTLLLLFLVACLGGKTKDPVVAEVYGEKILKSQLERGIKMQVYQLEERLFSLRKDALEELVSEKILEKEAKARNMSIQDLFTKEVLEKVAEVTDVEAKKYIKDNNLEKGIPDRQNPGKFIKIDTEEVKRYLKHMKNQEAQDAFMKTMMAKAGYKNYLKTPDRPKLEITPNANDERVSGPKNAPIVITEISDFECPFCARAVGTVKQVVEAFPGKIRLEYKFFPLSYHPNAKNAAIAAVCVGKQGKFWDFHNYLFANNSNLSEKKLREYAKSFKIDMKLFDKCYKSKEAAKEVEDDISSLGKAGVSSTPTFVVNGVLLSGAQPFEKFKEVIEEILNK